MQTSTTAVSPVEVMSAHGYGPQDYSVPNDAYEYSNKLVYLLEKRCEGTPVDGWVAEIFKGKDKGQLLPMSANDYAVGRIEEF